MNPGTTIIILLGIIGLLLYASQAFKETKEGFALVGEDQLSTKTKDAMDELKQGTMNFQSLFGAFATPDLNEQKPITSPYAGGGPSPADFAAAKPSGPTNELLPDIKVPDMNSSSPLPLPPLPSTALPLTTPGATLTSSAPGPSGPATVSDAQGANLLKATLPMATPAPSISSIAATAGSITAAATSITSAITDKTAKIEPLTNRLADPVTTIHPKQTIRKPSAKGRIRVKTKIVYLPKQCPSVDLSQYVRKDAIPCWGCNLK